MKSTFEQSNNYYHEIFENISDLVFIISQEGVIKFVSPSIKSILGYKVEEVLNTLVFRFVHPDDLNRIKGEYKELLANPLLVQDVLLRIISKDGKVKFIKGKRKNLLSNPIINGIVLSVQDVTDIIEAQKTIQRTNNLLDKVELISNTGGWEWDIREQTLLWTKGTYRIHDFDEISELPVSKELVNKSIACYHAKDQVIISESLNNCINQGIPYDLECRFISAKGRNLWIRTTGSPVYEEGKIVKVCGNIRDITDIKREELLNQSRMELINRSYNSTLDEFIQIFLDEAEKLTESSIGFYHFVDDNQDSLHLQTWSSNTLKTMCTADGKGAHYQISKAGVWADCFYTRVPVIHNNYESLLNKKGMPEGHAKVVRELVVPIIRQNKVVAILGVGNKDFNYDDNDVSLVTRLAEFAWDITERKQIELELKRSEEKFRQIVENSSEVFYRQDFETGVFEYISPKVFDLLGITDQEIITFNLEEQLKMFHPLDIPSVVNFRDDLLEADKNGNKFVEREFRMIIKNGNYKWIHGNYSLIKDRRGNPKLIVGGLSDITEKRIAEEKIKISEERFRLINDASLDSIYSYDLNGRFSSVNYNLCATLGLNPEQIIGRTHAELGFPKNLCDEWEELHKKVKRTNASVIAETYAPVKDGELRYFEVVLNPLHDNAGKIIGISGVTKDITERKKAEERERENQEIFRRKNIELEQKNIELKKAREATLNIIEDLSFEIEERKLTEQALRESEEKFRHSFEYSALAICTVGINGKFQKVNNAFVKLFGYSQDEITDLSFSQITYPDDISRGTRFFEQALKGKISNSNFEKRYLTKDSSIVWGNVSSSLVRDFNGNPQFFITQIEDITEKKQAELQLEVYQAHLEDLVKARTEELDKVNEFLRMEIEKEKEFELMLKESLEKEKELSEMKSRFISTTSHEFRTPLTSVLSSTELLQRYGEKWSEEKKNEHFKRIEKSVEYLTKLLDDILTISRTETGKISFKPEPVDLEKFAFECTRDAKLSMTELHEIKMNYKSKQKQFELDPKLMKFIFNNLLSNAVKYSPKGGEVKLNISTDRKNINIEVSDKGIGIPSEDVHKIFESFYRTKNAEGIGGTGLGLAIVKRAVEMHGGEINVTSKLNVGTTFNVKLPKR